MDKSSPVVIYVMPRTPELDPSRLRERSLRELLFLLLLLLPSRRPLLRLPLLLSLLPSARRQLPVIPLAQGQGHPRVPGATPLLPSSAALPVAIRAGGGPASPPAKVLSPQRPVAPPSGALVAPPPAPSTTSLERRDGAGALAPLPSPFEGVDLPTLPDTATAPMPAGAPSTPRTVKHARPSAALTFTAVVAPAPALTAAAALAAASPGHLPEPALSYGLARWPPPVPAPSWSRGAPPAAGGATGQARDAGTPAAAP